MGLISSAQFGTSTIHTLPMVFIDVETTGVSRTEGGEICEIGAVKLNPVTLKTLDELNLKLQIKNPQQRSEPELSFNGYNGFSLAEWKDALPPKDGIHKLNDFCTSSVAWAWNVSFEFYWLSSYYEEFQVNWKGDYHWICLMSICNHVFRSELANETIPKLSLSKVSEFLGLGEEPNPHRGLIGAQYEAEIYRKLRELK